MGKDHAYLDDYTNRMITQKVARNCYLPMNGLLLDLIRKFGKKFKVAFSISGIAIEQFRMYAPEVLDSFQQLARTGSVEFLAETYSHSLASLIDQNEFIAQVKQHCKVIESEFGVKPKAFRNTELIYSDEIGQTVASMGFRTILTEGAKHILGWKSPNYLYANALNQKLHLLLRNFKLSDDIAFRFSDRSWNEWPLTADKYVSWLSNPDVPGEMINLFMDYETFGEHQKAESGIFDFMRYFPDVVIKDGEFEFVTPEQAGKKHKAVAQLDVPDPISWADEERDITAWLGNELQSDAFQKLYSVSEKIALIDENDQLWSDFGHLQESDHFYYMCTKFFSDGAVHKYFNPYDTPYEAFINYMNVLSDFILRVDDAISVSDVNFAAEKKAAPAKAKTETAEKKTVRKVTARKSVKKTAPEAGEKKQAARKTVKTKK